MAEDYLKREICISIYGCSCMKVMSMTTRSGRRPVQHKTIKEEVREEASSSQTSSQVETSEREYVSTVSPEFATEQVQRFLALGDRKSAEYWIDKKWANECAAKDRHESAWIRYADYVQNLAACGCYNRVISICDKYSLHVTHIFFMNYYLSSLAEQKKFIVIAQAPLAGYGADLEIDDLALQSASPCLTPDTQLPAIPQEHIDELDKRVENMKLRSNILVNIGKAFIAMENRDAASKCISNAFKIDPTNLQAENLIIRYRLVPNVEIEKMEKSRQEECHIDARGAGKYADLLALNTDPRELVIRANILYDKGDAKSANEITKEIIDKHGLYQDALLLHISSLVQLEDADQLFLIAHRLVDEDPDSELTWYAVALYYFVIKNTGAAKSFMNKAVTMNENFGEGWVAFGHILSYDCEHEQSQICYLRAARILEQNFEPQLYIAMGHCFTNNYKLAADFLADTARISPLSPIVLHERGALAFLKKDFEDAYKLFSTAISIVCGMKATETVDPSSLIRRPIDLFWEPLVNNLGHTSRRLGLYENAIKFHEKGLLMHPRKLSTLTSLGLAYACNRRIDMAAQLFHKALAIKPFNNVVRMALEKMIMEQHDIKLLDSPAKSLKMDELREALRDTTKEVVKKANAFVCINRQKDVIKRRPLDITCKCSECCHSEERANEEEEEEGERMIEESTSS